MRWRDALGNSSAELPPEVTAYFFLAFLTFFAFFAFFAFLAIVSSSFAGRPPRVAGCAPVQCQDHLIRLGLSVIEMMILVGSGSTKRPTKVSFRTQN